MTVSHNSRPLPQEHVRTSRDGLQMFLMDYVSFVKLFILLVYITAIPQCEGRNRHAQRSRSRRDWYPNSFVSPSSSFSYYSSKLREEQLLMEISERLSQIILQLNQQKQQQPMYVPIYVPYFVPHNMGNNVSYNEMKNRKKLINTTHTTKKDNTETEITIRVGENEGGLKSDPVKDIEGDRIGSPKDIPNTGASEQLKCQIAIVACCRFSENKQKMNCFEFYKCPETFNYNLGCDKKAIDDAVIRVVKTYEPK